MSWGVWNRKRGFLSNCFMRLIAKKNPLKIKCILRFPDKIDCFDFAMLTCAKAILSIVSCGDHFKNLIQFVSIKQISFDLSHFKIKTNLEFLLFWTQNWTEHELVYNWVLLELDDFIGYYITANQSSFLAIWIANTYSLFWISY